MNAISNAYQRPIYEFINERCGIRRERENHFAGKQLSELCTVIELSLMSIY